MSGGRPIGEELVHDLDEQRLHEHWERVRERMASRRGAATRRAWRGVALAAVVGLGTWLLWPGASPGPIRHADGAALHAAEAVAVPRMLELDDDSRIELATGTRLVPERNDARTLVLQLERGRARFEVTPGGDREWVVDAGLAQVRVLGTAFVVDRGAERVRVEVERGRVRVEGGAVPGGRRVLEAGDALDVRRAPDAVAPASGATRAPVAQAPRERRAEPNTEATVEPAAAPRPERGTRARWRELASEGDHQGAFEAIGEDAFEGATERADPAELLLLADVARRSGHPGDAVAPLERLLAAHPDHAEAPLAAITLARLQLGPLARPAAALRTLRRARELGVPRLFDAEVCSSLARAMAAVGDLEGARAEARECLGRHGAPPNHERLRSLVEGSP